MLLSRSDCDACPKDCRHLGKVAEMPCCNYIFNIGRPRPCPAGAGCTEYQGGGKLSKRNWDRDLAAELYAKGWSDADIAEACNVMPSTIGSWRRQQKLSPQTGAAVPVADEAASLPLTPPVILPKPEPNEPSIHIELECGCATARADNHEALLALAEGLLVICRCLCATQKEENYEQ